MTKKNLKGSKEDEISSDPKINEKKSSEKEVKKVQ